MDGSRWRKEEKKRRRREEGRREEGRGEEGRGGSLSRYGRAKGCSIASSQHKRSINRMTSPLLCPSLPPSPPPSSLCKDSLRHARPAPRSAYKGCVMQLSGHKRNFTHQQEETRRGEKPLNSREEGSFLQCFPHIQNI